MVNIFHKSNIRISKQILYIALGCPFNGQSLNLVLYLCCACTMKKYNDVLHFGVQGSLFQDVPQKSNEYQNMLGIKLNLPRLLSVQSVENMVRHEPCKCVWAYSKAVHHS